MYVNRFEQFILIRVIITKNNVYYTALGKVFRTNGVLIIINIRILSRSPERIIIHVFYPNATKSYRLSAHNDVPLC